MSDIVPKELMGLAAELRDTLSSYQDAEDLITIGAYKPGQNARVDRAVGRIDKVNAFLKQASSDPSNLQESWKAMAMALHVAPQE
jgi:flagellum-specific ATP synthase